MDEWHARLKVDGVDGIRRRAARVHVSGLRLEVGRVNRASREVKDNQEGQRITEAEERARMVEQISGREIFVKNISEAGGFAH